MENGEIATLGGGCFWCLQPIFEEIKGVIKVEVGYCGGRVPNPSYQQVCTGKTGHAEVVHVTFDPRVISFEELLEVFFSVHDPTTPNRQGPDVGPQYRSAIFCHTSEQKTLAERVIAELNKAGSWKRPVVTEVTPFDEFHRAEDYHQDYYRRNPRQAYCRVVIAPKIAKFRERFPVKLKG
ncbi:MAG: peptide-methionine (S)-S-oxide reductase MsrA [Candidatus Geothermarchaeales archaeon]